MTSRIGSRDHSGKKEVRCQRGVTMLETLIATVILLVGVMAQVGLFGVTVVQNWNQGDRATRTTEFAQDKMEQLMVLNFADTTTNTAVYPATTIGGTGLTPGGSVPPAAPVAGYVDYLDSAGTIQAGAAGAAYRRQWSMTVNAAGNLKTITVVASALTSPGGGAGVAPSTTLVSMQSSIQ
jgi:Tfp pilus assembly protein PilV